MSSPGARTSSPLRAPFNGATRLFKPKTVSELGRGCEVRAPFRAPFNGATRLFKPKTVSELGRGRESSSPFAPPLKPGMAVFKPKTGRGARFSFLGAKGSAPARGSFLRQPRVPAVGAMSSPGARTSSPLRNPLDGATRLFKPKLLVSSAGGAKFEPPFRAPFNAQHVCSSQKLSVSSAGVRSPSPFRAPFEARNGCIQAKNRRGRENLLFGCERLGFCLFFLQLAPMGLLRGSTGRASQTGLRLGESW